MCLILFAQNQHPDYSLVLAANRDEFYARETRTAHRWNNDSDLVAGKDLEAGGTWMGINGKGQIAAVTNYRDLTKKRLAIRSRGEIVTRILATDHQKDSLWDLTRSNDFDGFNLLHWDGECMTHTSNISRKITRVEDGVHGLSNHLLNTPWFKVEQGKRSIKEHLRRNEELLVAGLFEMLGNSDEAADDDLPKTGLPKDLEKKVSSMFIKTENYGTRCSSVILVRKDGTIRFEERSYVPEANAIFEL